MTLKDPTHLIWLDMEMSGLDPSINRPLEVATLVTTAALDIVAEGPNLVIHQPDDVLALMDGWNTEHHGASGLTAAVRASTIKELVRRWYGVTAPPKKTAHRALDDIKESVDELRWYQRHAFREALDPAVVAEALAAQAAFPEE